MKHLKTFESHINESYIVTGESDMNKNAFYYVNDEDGVTTVNKDKSKRPGDETPEKIFSDRKSAEKMKKKLKNWRDDIRWYIETK